MILDLPVVLDYGPAYEDYNKRIIKTLQQMVADGRKKATIKSAIWTLRTLNRNVDLMNPDAVKLYIAYLKDKNGEPASDATKHKPSNNPPNKFRYSNETKSQQNTDSKK